MVKLNVDTRSLKGFVVDDLTHLDPWNSKRQELQNSPEFAQSPLDEHFSNSWKNWQIFMPNYIGINMCNSSGKDVMEGFKQHSEFI